MHVRIDVRHVLIRAGSSVAIVQQNVQMGVSINVISHVVPIVNTHVRSIVCIHVLIVVVDVLIYVTHA